MSALSLFSPEERDFLIGLFYRTGLYISHADDDGTTQRDDEKETKALLSVLNFLSGRKKYGEMVSELAAEAAHQNKSWKRWAQQEESFLDDAAKAAKMISTRFNKDDVLHFKKALMLVGSYVAKSYREEADYAQEEAGIFGELGEKITAMMTAITDRQSHDEMSVSPAEYDALHALHKALK